MDKQEYIAQVLAQLPGLLEKEKKAVKRELLDHLEDRMEPLLALRGVDEAEAERRSVAAMGDPVETGKEIARQYQSFFWVVLKDIATGFLALFLMLMFVVGGRTTDLPNSILARVDPARIDHLNGTLDFEMDYRMEVGNDIVWVYEAQVRDGMFTARIVTYDRIPGGVVAWALEESLWLENESGTQAPVESTKVLGWGYGACCYWASIPVETEDESVTLTCGLYGTYTRLTIPLSEVTA